MRRDRSSVLRGTIAATVVAATLVAAAGPAAPGSTGFEAHVSRISPELKERMTGNSWHKGCPVPIRKLRLIRLSYNGFDGERHMGKLVANKDAVDVLVGAFRTMYRKGFKIHRMKLVDAYGADDRRSMRADNTSAFNCRYVSGTTTWSQHAYGRAIDINPVRNPYVSSDGSVRPRKGKKYADRSLTAKGMIHRRGATVRAFNRAGWGWGGNWSTSKDYQHFSATGS
jgi:hypothetical protein